ncbi:MAG: protein-glutamate O-methyltransferase [Gammaproteobacteria bacterium]|nr:protein-glutamate O-methyltransferase [Gammaproteobacteria bacterium]
MPPAQPREREFELTDQDFTYFRDLVGQHTGITLGEHKRQLVYGRLSRRLRELRLTSFGDYCQYVETHADTELTEVINAITTNLTSFFREQHHFEHLATAALPEIQARNTRSRRLRIWSAGCSTGEEPYSIAMTVAETFPNHKHWDTRILATDIDSQVIACGQKGVYPDERIKDISPERARRWFLRGTGANANKVRVSPRLQELIAFRQLNLMGGWPMRGPFDVIFCRNVVIYFDKPTQRKLFDRYADLLAPEGYLYVGHSESLNGTSERFELIGRTIYKRIA